MRDYTWLYRRALPIGGLWGIKWDVFVSAYNDSERVRRVFDMVEAGEKHWLVHGEYGYDEDALGIGDAFWSAAQHEADFVLEFWESRLGDEDLGGRTLCIDSTGFMRPHLMFFVALLCKRGVERVDVLYAEPDYYERKERTVFSKAGVEEVRQVAGFEGSSAGCHGRDVVVIGAGYEKHLVEEVAEDKEDARKIVVTWTAVTAGGHVPRECVADPPGTGCVGTGD